MYLNLIPVGKKNPLPLFTSFFAPLPLSRKSPIQQVFLTSGSRPPLTCSPPSCPFHLFVVAQSRPLGAPSLWELPSQIPATYPRGKGFQLTPLPVIKVSFSEKTSFITLSATLTLYYMTLLYFHHTNWYIFFIIIYLPIDRLFPLEW